MKRILRPGHNCSSIDRVTGSGLLIDGEDYYRAFYQAAESARKTIMIAGWQFDSDVRLLRGREERHAGGDVRLLPFLDSLCERNRELEVYILAWDFSIFFSLDHQWVQRWLFNWSTNERLHFQFDSVHAIGASHHLKLVVIDGVLAFAGGLDICSRHWDGRGHAALDMERWDGNGAPYGPYHDVQAYITGPPAQGLSEYFRNRWLFAGGKDFGRRPPAEGASFDTKHAVPVAAGEVAVSRTQARLPSPPLERIQEIKFLYADAISAAEELIYIENQFFSSRWVYSSLLKRLNAPDMPRLQAVIVLPKRFNAFLEEMTLAMAQVNILRSLVRAAAENGHSLGIYYASSMGEDGSEVQTYIHSKVLIADDRFLSVGSANLSNRSISLDTELNLSWEAWSPGHMELADSIRRVRADLLAEHTGLSEKAQRRRLEKTEGLVDYLDGLSDLGRCRLHRHKMETIFEDYKWLKSITPENFGFDPEKPLIGEDWYESVLSDEGAGFSASIKRLIAGLPAPPRPGKIARAERAAIVTKDRILREARKSRRRKYFLYFLLYSALFSLLWAIIKSCYP